MAEAAIGIRPGKAMCQLEERKTLICQLLASIRDVACGVYDSGMRCAIADDLCVDGVVPLLLHGPIDAIRMSLPFLEEELLALIKGGSRELVHASVQVFHMDGTSLSPCAQQFWACRVPVDHDKGGYFGAVGLVSRNLEHIMDAGVFEVNLPPRTWVDAWLRACRRGGPHFLFLLLSHSGDLHVDVALHQDVHDVGEGGRCIEWVDLEELERGRRHGRDGVGRRDGLAIGPKVMDWGCGDVDMEGVQMCEHFGVDLVGRRDRERRAAVDRLDFPVIILCGVLQLRLLYGKVGTGCSWENGGRVKVTDRRDRDRWGGREVNEHRRYWLVEEGRPVCDHRGMHERPRVCCSVVVHEHLDPLVLVFACLLHDVASDLFAHEGDDRGRHVSVRARSACDGPKGAVVGSFVRGGGWRRRGDDG